MRLKSLLSALVATLCLMTATPASAAIQDGKFVPATPKVGLLGQTQKQHHLSLQPGQTRNFVHAAATPDNSFQASSFGFLENSDGETWFYTMSNQPSSEYDYCYSASTVTVYDGKRHQVGSFTVQIPDTMRVNMIEPFGIITNKLFDNKSNTAEVTVFFHEVTPDYTGHQFVRVYSLDGSFVTEIEGDGMVVSSPINEWTPYQRYVSVNNNETDPLLTDINIYRPASWGEEGIQLDHTFSISSLLINYMDAPFFNFYADGANSCFVLSHYEKSFDLRDEDGNMVIDPESYMPDFTPDNNFVIETYDRYYNLVDSFGISTNPPYDDIMVRMMGIGAFSDIDINRGIFTHDGHLSYIVMYEDVAFDTEYTYSFVAYSHTGENLGTIAEYVSDYWNRLSSIPGCEEQFVFLDTNTESLYTVDLPSLRTRYLPVSLDDRNISTNIDRYASASDPQGYRYVTGINAADVDEEYNVISLFGHMNSNGSLHHFVRFNMGQYAQTFTPLVNFQSLDPYLFDSDSDREYIFFSKLRNDFESTQGRNVLFVGNEKGEIIRTFDPLDTDPGNDIWTAAIMNYGTPEASLIINFYNWDEDMNRVDFYGLPFNSFMAGGDGTEANPYLISSAGDLQLIERNPSACYRVACDFDAYGYPVSIAEFSGTLDGDGHTISNLSVTSNHYYAGLFGNTTGATVRNLKFYNPSVELNSANSSFGLISAYSVESHFEQIAVMGLEITGNSYVTPLGGLVGMAAASTVISECLVDGSSISGGNTFGGLVGEMRTSSVVRASAVTDISLNGWREVGGIAGIVGTGCLVTDCYSRASVSAVSYAGGVVGRLGVNGNRASIARCLADASVITDLSDSHSGFAALVGYVEPAWTRGDTTVCISNSVAVNSYIVTPADCTAPGSSIHAVAGHTKLNLPAEKEGDDMNEYGLRQNYVYHDIEPDAENAYFGGGNDATGVEGLAVSADVLAPQSFWQGLGYVFGGTSADAPWKFEEGRLPWLWVMDESNAPSSLPAISTRRDSSSDAVFYNLSGQRIAFPQGFVVVGGKKIFVK